MEGEEVVNIVIEDHHSDHGEGEKEDDEQKNQPFCCSQT